MTNQCLEQGSVRSGSIVIAFVGQGPWWVELPMRWENIQECGGGPLRLPNPRG